MGNISRPGNSQLIFGGLRRFLVPPVSVESLLDQREKSGFQSEVGIQYRWSLGGFQFRKAGKR
jgi:hypothetical protein